MGFTPVSTQDYLTTGRDHFYYHKRDYLVNDVAPLHAGQFVTIVVGQDKATESNFAMKQNDRDDMDKIESLRAECNILAQLRGGHDNIVQFFGAVMEENEREYPPRVCKMFMEFAEGESNLVQSFLLWGKAATSI